MYRDERFDLVGREPGNPSESFQECFPSLFILGYSLVRTLYENLFPVYLFQVIPLYSFRAGCVL